MTRCPFSCQSAAPGSIIARFDRVAKRFAQCHPNRQPSSTAVLLLVGPALPQVIKPGKTRPNRWQWWTRSRSTLCQNESWHSRWNELVAAIAKSSSYV